VHDLGYIADEEMDDLYLGATALLMPTFFGPTVGIPVLEAWAVKCPVLTSDIRGIREQAGDAAVLVDPMSVESIGAGIRRLWCDEKLREELKRRGAARLRLHCREEYQEKLRAILAEAKDRARVEGPRRPPIGSSKQEPRHGHRRQYAGMRNS
jgi:glycosyltransferase involved in cell wall biosynthesis